MLQALLLLAQLQIPAPVGYVNDFAGILDPVTRQRLLGVIEEVRRKSGGEIVVVTLPDLGGRPSIEVARDIGRAWKVGAQGGPGERARNAGVVLLLKPGERPGDGKAELAIATGTGAEGFITDAYAGRVRDAIGRTAVERASYAAGLAAGVWLLAQAYAREFGFELSGTPPPAASGEGDTMSTVAALAVPIFMLLVFLSLAAASRRAGRRSGVSDWLWWSLLLGGGHGPRSFGGGWRGGGFGGGGFGGFGGGGGFSGGGASGRF
jgi:uncharacterized protein